MRTNGDAGAVRSRCFARCGIGALVVGPDDAPTITRGECEVSGPRLYVVDGHMGDAGVMATEAVLNVGPFDAGTLREPYRVEGKKTMSLEIFQQLGWGPPDVIIYPTGGGVGLLLGYRGEEIDHAHHERFQAFGAGDSDLGRRVAAAQVGTLQRMVLDALVSSDEVTIRPITISYAAAQAHV